MNLDLFTPIKEFTPKLKKAELIIECKDSVQWKNFAFWNGKNWIATRTKMICYPTHVLDLSKLTTKEKAIELSKSVLDSYMHRIDNEDLEFVKEKAKEIL